MKRFFDIIISVVALFVFAPVLITVALMVQNKLGKPILFVQDRPGKNGRLFRLYKFRSMLNETDETGRFLSDEQRLTEFGKKLRSTSLDELPSLINVIKGDLSLVGPRPLLPEYTELYNDRQSKRLNVRPGITGWAQINGRNAISWEQKFEFDVWYVENRSFLLDLKILVKTLSKVINRSDISEDGVATATKFKGSQ